MTNFKKVITILLVKIDIAILSTITIPMLGVEQMDVASILIYTTNLLMLLKRVRLEEVRNILLNCLMQIAW